ncbi:LAETG motif-containing sortase-dependent surface protein [Micromonospora sp. NPDC050417]|uniref:LAETG motif-containing sortase-dependent surface protein n=1 Tax=Micromonospora sp. NPDC050417 TaxID=3364280 RepID=UPI00379CFA99
MSAQASAPATETAASTPDASLTATPGSDPSFSAANLAESGGSSSTPIIVSLAGAILVAGAASFFLIRKRRTARNELADTQPIFS